MRSELLQGGEHMITVCNACRYCEQYCPVFPAIEERLRFGKADLVYLANLCHNCGECLYACQYSPPHEFGIDLPRKFAELRIASYEEYCWPSFLGGAFRQHGLVTGVLLAAALSAVMLASVWWMNPDALTRPNPEGDFYTVIPHAVMVGLFGSVSLFVVAAFAMGLSRFWRDIHAEPGSLGALPMVRGLRDALTLRHMNPGGVECTTGEEVRTPWRRWFHHATFYGFLLCFASTSIAAVYDALGWSAPYPYTSLPVILGTSGGIGLLVGPLGLMVHRRKRDPALADPAESRLDESFLALLFLTSLSGLLLLVLRDRTAMAILLVVHLGIVLALFVTLPYGKFVHGLYRLAALVKYNLTGSHQASVDRP
jgi:citrate/tricarballylate utilization protein